MSSQKIDASEFSQTVAKFIEYDEVSGNYNKDKARILADEFEAARSTIVRWVTGISNPHLAIKKGVTDYISRFNK